jgi:hypothetical protein
MGARLLGCAPTIIAAPVIGATAGAAAGAMLGTVAWTFAASGLPPCAVAFFALAGGVAGLAAATSTSLALVIVAGTTRVTCLGLFAGVGAATSWLMAHASRRLLATRLPRDPVTASAIAGYLVALALTIILAIVFSATLIHLLNT